MNNYGAQEHIEFMGDRFDMTMVSPGFPADTLDSEKIKNEKKILELRINNAQGGNPFAGFVRKQPCGNKAEAEDEQTHDYVFLVSIPNTQQKKNMSKKTQNKNLSKTKDTKSAAGRKIKDNGLEQFVLNYIKDFISKSSKFL